MGLAANQARLNFLTLRKSDLEYRLIMLTNQTQILATEQAEAVSKKAKALDKFNSSEAAKDINVSFSNTAEYAEYETAMAQLEAAQTRLDNEQKALETEHQAISAEHENVQKLVDNNIKKSFGYFN